MLSNKDIQINNHFNANLVSKLRKQIKDFDEDAKKELRLKRKLCKTCFYLRTGRLAGQAFTNSTCNNCEGIIVNPSTDVNKICDKCSDELNVCVKCTGNIER